MLKHCHSDQTRSSLIKKNCTVDLDHSLTSHANSSFNDDSDSVILNRSTSFLQDSRRSSVTMNNSSFSRTSSFVSLASGCADHDHRMIKIYSRCLRNDVEYKTLSVSRTTTATEVIWMLLSKFKMRHRDPKLFYLTMDIGIISHGDSGLDDSFTRTLVLEDEACPAELQLCHPWGGECRFTLQTRRGGLVRIYDSVLMAESRYKCLLISETTTAAGVISILFHCYGLERVERVDAFDLHLVIHAGSETSIISSKRLQPQECPVKLQNGLVQGNSNEHQYKFILQRAVTFLRPPSSTSGQSSSSPTGSVMSDDSTASSTSSSIESPVVRPPFGLFSHQGQSRVSHLAQVPPKANFSLSGPVTHPRGAPTGFHPMRLPTDSSLINKCGLPPSQQQVKQPSSITAPISSSMMNMRSRSRTRVAFHDYENYFYI